MASESQWRWVDRNGVQRVLSFDTLADALRNGALGRDVPVWREGMPAFMPAGWVPELENACTQAPLTTAADAAAVGEISPPTQASLEAFQRLINPQKSSKDPRQSPTVPSGKSMRTAILGSQAPHVAARPLPPSPMAAPRKPRPHEKSNPLDPPSQASHESTTANAPTPSSPPAQSSPPIDTPPATPLAIQHSGQRSSSEQIETSRTAMVPSTPIDPSSPLISTETHPSHFDQTMPSNVMRAEFERLAQRRRLLRILFASLSAIVLLIGVLALIALRTRNSKLPQPETAPTTALSVESIPDAAPAQSAVPLAASTTPEPSVSPSEKSEKACKFQGIRKRLVVGASKDIPMEVWSDPSERLVAVGFASRNHTALGFVLDPKTLTPERSFTKQASLHLTRVVPLNAQGTITFETDEQAPAAAVLNPLTVACSPPARLGTFKGSLTIRRASDTIPEILWKLPFGDTLEAMRALPIPGKGIAVVFRANHELWLGWISEDHKAVGDLQKIQGVGEKTGTPSLGWNGRRVLVAFADLPSDQAPWAVRVAEAAFGDTNITSSPLKFNVEKQEVPRISPAVLGLADGRWVLVFTEGSAGSRSVRLQTFDSDLQPLEEPCAISKTGDNAGQGLATVGKTGGVVVYLTSIGPFYEVWAAGIDCQ